MSQRFFNFNNIFKTRESYEENVGALKNEILGDFSLRKIPAIVLIGSDTVESTLGKVLLDFMLMKSWIETSVKMDKTYLYELNEVTESNLIKYFNKILTRMKTYGFTNAEIRERIYETQNNLSEIYGDLNEKAGNGISFHDYVRLYAEEDKEFMEITSYQLPEVIQFDEVESTFKELGDRIERFFSSRPDCDLYSFEKAETGINKKQMTQAFGIIGTKPDIDEKVIPVPISDNFLKGLSGLENYFINAKGTRKALITNFKKVRQSGYLTHKLSLAMVDRYHDNNIVDCHTKHYVKYIIDQPEKINMLKGQHYYLLEDDKPVGELKTIVENDQQLLGQVIALRSPVTCCGERVCRTCYGTELSEINKDLNTGLIAVFYLTDQLTQMLLSAKHCARRLALNKQSAREYLYS